jgi:hypothetical protein
VLHIHGGVRVARTYAHASMDVEHRKLSAGIPLVVRMILDAKEKGLTLGDRQVPGSGVLDGAAAEGLLEPGETVPLVLAAGVVGLREGLGSARTDGRAALSTLREEGPSSLKRAPAAAAQRASSIRERLRGREPIGKRLRREAGGAIRDAMGR